MVEKVTVTKVYKSDKDKKGNIFKTKNGKLFWKVAIQTDKYGEDWFSTLVFEPNAPEWNLEVGQEYLVSIWEKDGYKNFRLPTKIDLLEGRVEKLEKNITEIVAKIKEITKQDITQDNTDLITDDGIDASKIPF